MPLASDGDEGRGKRRNGAGTCWQGLIRTCPNGATHCLEETVPGDRGERGELKHLSSRRNRKQCSDAPSSGERTGHSPNRSGHGRVGVVGPLFRNHVKLNDLGRSTTEGESPVGVQGGDVGES